MAVAHRRSGGRDAVEHSINELERLAESAGAVVLQKIIQALPNPSKESYVGKGKLEEITALREELDYNLVIFDEELTPNQQRNLENSLGVKVLDRVALILDIFAERARTKEGRLQVELAQLEYLLPRLAGQWSHLERLGGGIGTRGPGESQLETDRRLINKRIQRLKRELEDVRRHRALHRQRRKKTGTDVVSLVGYTNAGKSTLLNAMSGAEVYADDRLFATLDPTTRRLIMPDNTTVLLTDTVGFIRKLPPAIVEAFRATLEELDEAALLLHITDISSDDADEQCDTVEGILRELGVDEKPRITVLNKIDSFLEKAGEKASLKNEAVALAYFDRQAEEETAMVHVSAARGWGLERLRQAIAIALKHEKPKPDNDNPTP